jgi:hypothetical protein
VLSRYDPQPTSAIGLPIKGRTGARNFAGGGQSAVNGVEESPDGETGAVAGLRLVAHDNGEHTAGTSRKVVGKCRNANTLEIIRKCERRREV